MGKTKFTDPCYAWKKLQAARHLKDGWCIARVPKMTYSSTPVLLVALLSILVLYPLDPAFTVGDFEPIPYEPDKLKPKDTSFFQVIDETFVSDQLLCHAWLYLPKATSLPPPVVIIGSGLGAQKDLGPQRYARRFASEAFAVFSFDYRSFGASEGFPRNLVSPTRHIEDWNAAIDHIIATNGLQGRVDPNRIFLFGTSFSGGHVLMIASQQKYNLLGIISQVPHLSGVHASKRSLLKRGILGTIRLAVAAIQDKARSMIGMSPVSAKICGTTDDDKASIMLVSPEEYSSYAKKIPTDPLGGWINQTPARILLEFRTYNPLFVIERGSANPISTPVLLIGAEKDELCPPKLVEKAAALLQDSTYISRPATHFEMYEPQNVEVLLPEMVAFYQRLL